VTWARGQDDVERLLADGELEPVPPNIEHAERLLDEARRHHDSATALEGADAPGCLQLSYDCARKACLALLAAQGLRSTSRGGHGAVQDAVRAQFGGDQMRVFNAYSRLRRRRNNSEYADATTPTVTAEDASDAIDISGKILDAATKVLGSGSLSPFRS
jgi:hypothetical protein